MCPPLWCQKGVVVFPYPRRLLSFPGSPRSHSQKAYRSRKIFLEAVGGQEVEKAVIVKENIEGEGRERERKQEEQRRKEQENDTEEKRKLKKEEEAEEEGKEGEEGREIPGVFRLTRSHSRFSHDRRFLWKIKTPLGSPLIGSFQHIASL